MKPHSQPSLEQQVAKLQQEAKQATDLAFSKNAEVKAAQKKLDSLKGDIEAQTRRLLEEQTAKINSALKPLTKQVDDLLKRRKKLEDDISVRTRTIEGLTVEARRLQDTLDKRNVAITDADRVLEDANAGLGKVSESVNGHTIKEKELVSTISDLATEQTTLTSSVESLRSDVDVWQRRLDGLESVFNDKKTAKDHDINILEAKVLKRAQELDALKEEELTLRSSLAAWERRLQEQDKNLRIRELKVSQGETKLVQNAGLLNL